MKNIHIYNITSSVMDNIRNVVSAMPNRELVLPTNRRMAWQQSWGLIPLLIVLLTVTGILTTTYFCRNLKVTYFDKVRFRRKLNQEIILTKSRIHIYKRSRARSPQVRTSCAHR